MIANMPFWDRPEEGFDSTDSIHLYAKVVLCGSAIFFIASGILKLAMLVPPFARVLQYPNPVFTSLPNWVVVLLAAVLEIVGGAAVLLRHRRTVGGLTCMLWLLCAIGLYRFCLNILDVHSSGCSCLGKLGYLLYPEDGGMSLAGYLLWGVGFLCVSALLLLLRAPMVSVRENTRLVRTIIGILVVELAAVPSFGQQLGSQDAVVGFRSSGTLSCTFYNAKAEAECEQQFTFDISVVGQTWDLKVPLNEGYMYHAFCDGRLTAEMILGPRTNKMPAQAATLHEEGFPLRDYYAGIPWFAYAYGVNDSKERHVPAPWMSPLHDPLAFAFELTVQKGSGWPHSPLEAWFDSDQERAQKALKHVALSVENVPRDQWRIWKTTAAAVTKGWLSAHYLVLATTNVARLQLPVNFELACYADIPAAATPTAQISGPPASAKPRLLNRFLGHATDFMTLSNALSWPVVTSQMSIMDRRFRSTRQGIDHIFYNITNSWILDKNDAELAQLFLAKRKAAPFIRGPLLQELLLYLLFSAFFLVPIVLWIKSRRGKHKIPQ